MNNQDSNEHIEKMNRSEINRHVSDWRNSLDRIEANKKELKDWWSKLLESDIGVTSGQKEMHLQAMDELLEMDVDKVEKMWSDYCSGIRTDNVEKDESKVHLFEAIVKKFHKLW